MKIVKPIIQVCSIVLVFVALILFVSNILCYQCSSDEARLKLYYNEKENSFNVMLFGASSVRAGFIPTKAYEKYGITSFNYCVNFMPLELTEYMVEEALSTQNPELLIIDINGITYCNEDATNTHSVAFTDAIRDGKNKLNALNALTDNNWENKVSFIKYHKNIYNLSKCLKYRNYYQKFGNNQTVLKGYTTNNTKIKDFKNDEILDHNQITNITELNDYEAKTLDKVLDYCEDLETEILFVRFPRPTIKNSNEREMGYINAAEKEIKDRGLNFVDFTDYIADMGIDFTKDFTDETHFNHFGAEKFTDFLSKYILDNYNITTKSDLLDWDLCVELANPYYEVIKEETVNETKKEHYEFEFSKRYNIFGIA